MIIAVEEERNKKITANAERGMAGFANYLGKIRGVQEPIEEDAVAETADVAGDVPSSKKQAPRDFRSRMEDKLKELKQKQEEKEEAQRERDE